MAAAGLVAATMVATTAADATTTGTGEVTDSATTVHDPEDAASKIEPRLQRKLETEQGTELWVRFEDEADLAAVSRSADWAERGAKVVEQLKQTAEKSQAAVRERLDDTGVEYEAFWATNAIYVPSGSQRLAGELAARPEVDSLHASRAYEAPEPIEGETVRAAGAVEWGISNINADDVWSQYGVTGEGITVASIDTGVDLSHPTLVDQYRGTGDDGSFDHDYNWFDASGRCEGAPCDLNGHGTHTMGTMVGTDGADNRIGVAPGVDWITANGCCGNTALIASGQWLLEPRDGNGQNPDVSKRPHIINNSWGSELPSTDPFMEDIIRAWDAAGIFSVWANGNIGPQCETSSSPGSRIISYSVGAYDVGNEIWTDSSRGAGQDGETKPNIAAPGVSVRSAWPGGRYLTGSGTSIAAPHVTGAVALAWAAAPALVGDIETTRQLLDTTAVDNPDSQCGGTSGDNNVFGEGRLDALALLDSAPVGDTGTLVTTVTDAATGEPIPGAEITITGPVDRRRSTGEDGTYSVPLRVGDYTVTAAAFGYADRTVEVTVDVGETVTQTIAMQALDTVTLSGRVTDGSGQGWPLYAEVSVDGMPGGTFHTDPEDGSYSFAVPAGSQYSLTIEPEYDGYQPTTEEVVVEDHDVSLDVELSRVTGRCTTDGYGYTYTGAGTGFDHGLPGGWTVTDNNDSGYTWDFDDPYDKGNQTGGTEGFAAAQSPGLGVYIDTSLYTPVFDLSDDDAPVIGFRQALLQLSDVADVDLSIDGGDTWETVLHQERGRTDGGVEEVIPIPQAAGQPAVQVRFHYYNARYSSYSWQLDDVFVGTRSCEPLVGGLVVGHISDRHTGDLLDGATVVSAADPLDPVESVATPDDPALDDGFYRVFVRGTGTRGLDASADRYADQTDQVAVGAGSVTRHDIALAAGRLEVDGRDVATAVDMGEQAEGTFTLTNTGTAPVELKLAERKGTVEVLRPDGTTVTREDVDAADGAEVRRVEGDFSPLGFDPQADRAPGDATTEGPGPARHEPAAAPWTDLTDYPMPIMDSTVGELDGKIYSVGGIGGRGQLDWVSAGFVYDPASLAWSPIADLPQPREAADGAFIGDRFYVTGGFGPDQRPKSDSWVYDPATDRWSSFAAGPRSAYAAGEAVIDGQLYLVGGCTNTCGLRDVRRYDPASDTWAELADYPVATAHLACAGIDGTLYCAGGIARDGTNWDRTFAYDPATDTWTRKADLPVTLWGMGYTGASGELLVSGGYVGGAITNEGWAYDPEADVWLDLPPSNHVLYRGGSACGLSRIGGTDRSGFVPVASAEQLPTYGDCLPADVSWLSLDAATTTLAPGEELQVTVGTSGEVDQPGTYSSGVWVREDTPYLVAPVDVTMNVEPPRRWGALMGTVTGMTCDGADEGPLAGAVVQIDGRASQVTVSTDVAGGYLRWLDRADMPMTITVTGDGYESRSLRVRPPGDDVPSVQDVVLEPSGC